MRISFRMEGGLAHVPGLSEPVSVDTDELPAEEASELERLIEAARFFELPATSALPRGAADYQKYTITVARSEEHTSELQSRQYLVCRLLLEKKESLAVVVFRNRRIHCLT